MVIEPGRTERRYWRDLWQYRELFLVLAWRDIAIRYKQTVIGIGWALIRPFLAMVIFTFIFGRLAKLPSDGTIPYPLMVFAGMLPWSFFSTSVTEASSSLIGNANANLITKVYFPRLILPIAAVMVGLIDFVISFVLFAALMVWYRIVPGWEIVLLPLFVAVAFMASFGIGTWITALNVKYRDFRYIIPFMLQLGLYLSPVGFTSTIVPMKWRLLFALNPLVGIIDGFRWCLFEGQSHFYLPGFALSIGITGFFVWLGVHTFRKMERSFADLI